MRQPIVYVLGIGINGLLAAYHAAKRGWKVVTVDRNDPFSPYQEKQTSHNAIGIIEPPGKRGVSHVCYVDTRAHFRRLLDHGFWWIQEGRIVYGTNVDGFLDGPNNREENERYVRHKGGKLGFKHAESFTNFVVNTNAYNNWLRRKLAKMGVHFVQAEIHGSPEMVTEHDGRPDLIIDCRGMELSQLDVGRSLVPVSGQTVLWHAPKGMEFDLVRGNPGPQISYNLVRWAPVNRTMVQLLGLEGKLDPVEGGHLILGGATKHEGDFNWEVQDYATTALVEGCARVDSRVRDLRLLAVRKGLRATMPQGVLYNQRNHGDQVIVTLAGWGGVTYCAGYGYTRQMIRNLAYSFKHGTLSVPQLI